MGQRLLYAISRASGNGVQQLRTVEVPGQQVTDEQPRRVPAAFGREGRLLPLLLRPLFL